MVEGDKIDLHQCSKVDHEIKEMHKFPYAFVVGDLIYAQVFMHPNVAQIVGMLSKYLSNLGLDQ